MRVTAQSELMYFLIFGLNPTVWDGIPHPRRWDCERLCSRFPLKG